MEPIYLDAKTLESTLSAAEAIEALENALLGDVEPEQDAQRLFSPAPDGEFLLMPAAGVKYSGVKVATIAPQNPSTGLPKIQGIYVLFDSRTLAPLAVMDGAELTLIRTPATTALAVKHILHSRLHGFSDHKPKVETMVVFGAGPQAWRHIKALQSVISVNKTVVFGRNKTTAAGAQQRRSHEVDVAVASADLIVCATSSSVPVFDGTLVKPLAVIAAIGSHGLNAREIDPELARRANVVVESRVSAMREAGDLIPARSVEEWTDTHLTNLAELVRGSFTRNPERPTLYTGAGMAWQDLVIASAIYDRLQERQP